MLAGFSLMRHSADPDAGIRAIAEFLPGVFLPGPAVREAIKPGLYHNRS
jgi:hypothetical protein